MTQYWLCFHVLPSLQSHCRRCIFHEFRPLAITATPSTSRGALPPAYCPWFNHTHSRPQSESFTSDASFRFDAAFYFHIASPVTQLCVTSLLHSSSRTGIVEPLIVLATHDRALFCDVVSAVLCQELHAYLVIKAELFPGNASKKKRRNNQRYKILFV